MVDLKDLHVVPTSLLIQFSTMARLFVFLVAIVAVLALVEGGKGNKKGAKGDRKGRRAAKKCAKNIKKFESCLKKGYQSKAGCISEDGELSKKDMKKCGRFEKHIILLLTTWSQNTNM